MQSTCKKVALFGGSFNPPHIAHQMICLYLLEYKDFDEVHLIPVFKHPFNKELIDFDHRYKMCNLLCAPFAGAEVNGIERHLVEEGITEGHTIDTVREYIRRRPNYDLTLVIGSDILHEVHKWKDFNTIKEMIDVLALTRKGYVVGSGKIRNFDILDQPNVSSTDIRDRIRTGGSPKGLVPLTILNYIFKHKLYSGD